METALQGTIDICEVLRYLEQDRYLGKRAAVAYLSLSARTLQGRLDEIPHFRVGRKILFRKSELDAWMERHRGRKAKLDVGEIVDEVLQTLMD